MAKKVGVVIGEKERTLAYPLMSLVRLKKEQSIELKDLQDKEKAEDIEVILAIIWAGLIHQERELTIEDVGYSIDISDVPEIAEKLKQIFAKDNDLKNSVE